MLLEQLKEKYKYSEKEFQDFVIKEILKTPYERLTNTQHEILFSDYMYGTFSLQERKDDPSFLFEEEQNFHNWATEVVFREIKFIKKDKKVQDALNKYSEEEIIGSVLEVLNFSSLNGETFLSQIPNQLYSDVINRIIGLLIFGDSLHEFLTAQEFNFLGEKIIPPIVYDDKYSLFQLFLRSQRAGIIGIDFKDTSACTSPTSTESIIPIGGNESYEIRSKKIFENLDNYVQNGVGFVVNDWPIFEKLVLENDTQQQIAWFTDDFIPSMFEMKFIEKLLLKKSNIKLYIIPRVMRCRNDICIEDIKRLLKERPEFQKLNELYKIQRFNIFEKGLDVGTFDGERLSCDCAELLIKSDLVFISGARSFEMGQGIKKPTFFMGVAVCRTYSETATGISSNIGGLLFVYTENGQKCFSNFKDRKTKRTYDPIEKRSFPVAGITTKEFIKTRKLSF